MGINVNTVAPGFADTEMTRDFQELQREQILKRSALRRTHIDDAVAFLLDDKAKNITGTVLTVNAGSTA